MIRFLALCCFVASFAATAVFAQDRPQVVQALDGFHRPTVAAFNPKQDFLFVINHAQGESGTRRGESFISRIKVASDGKLASDDQRFVASLTAPIDLAFSPRAFGDVPAGSIFLVSGSPLVQDDAGRGLKDLSRVLIGLQIIDPRSGRILKRIDLSPNSQIRLKDDEGLLAPSSICFDSQGNLYIGESGVGGHMFDRRQAGRPGIWRIGAEGLADLLADRAPQDVEFIRTSSLPSAMTYRDSEDMLYFVTNHTQGRPSGSVFRIRAGKYEGISSMQTIVRGLEALSGIQLTPSGRVLLVGNSGDLMFPKGKKAARPLRFRPKVDFSTPGKIDLMPTSDGGMLVAVPEQSSDAGLGRGQRVSIVKLPAGY